MTTKVAYMGGRQAGCTGLLALLAYPEVQVGVMRAYDPLSDALRERYGVLPWEDFPNPPGGRGRRWDLLVSVHGREIVPDETLKRFTMGGINVHPYLSRYPGADPVGRALADGDWQHASIGVHWMTDVVDGGEVILERPVDLSDMDYASRDEIYNALYPHYALALIDALVLILP